MIQRSLKPFKNNSLFLFGPRGTGKSTFAWSFLTDKKHMTIDLLLDADEERFGRHPDELHKVIALQKPEWVLVDEIQKAPKLLDIVHYSIEKFGTKFFLTGSSARKLKKVSSNLLAGRAYTYNMHPFTVDELGDNFVLKDVLQFGTLPKIYTIQEAEEKNLYLSSYAKTYLNEEIISEQFVRNVEVFRDFLPVAAQCNSKILNYSKIARDISSTDKTVKEYFEILEDTFMGLRLPAFHRSIRKSQKESPKFYFFDLGIKRALARQLNIPVSEGTYAYGEAFEHFIVLEIMRLNDYYKKDYRFSYLSSDRTEIDLVVERPGEPDLLIEIKSTQRVTKEDYKALQRFAESWDNPVQAQLWSNDSLEKMETNVECRHWQSALKKLFE